MEIPVPPPRYINNNKQRADEALTNYDWYDIWAARKNKKNSRKQEMQTKTNPTTKKGYTIKNLYPQKGKKTLFDWKWKFETNTVAQDKAGEWINPRKKKVYHIEIVEAAWYLHFVNFPHSFRHDLTTVLFSSAADNPKNWKKSKRTGDECSENLLVLGNGFWNVFGGRLRISNGF